MGRQRRIPELDLVRIAEQRAQAAGLVRRGEIEQAEEEERRRRETRLRLFDPRAATRRFQRERAGLE